MRVNVNVQVDLEPLLQKLEALKPPVQAAMAQALYDIVINNFGATGVDRPWPWKELRNKEYARKMGRSFATLFVTGKLRDTVEQDNSNPEFSTVSMGNTDKVSYALAHHFGAGLLAARRVFPIQENGELTWFSREHITDEATRTLREALA